MKLEFYRKRRGFKKVGGDAEEYWSRIKDFKNALGLYIGVSKT